MTHPMIEKCARAMYEDASDRYRDSGAGALLPWPDQPDWLQEEWIFSVIAVLLTLRTPDEGMQKPFAAEFTAHLVYLAQHGIVPVADVPVRLAEGQAAFVKLWASSIDSLLPEEKGTET